MMTTATDYQRELGGVIRARRLLLGRSQEELASDCGMHRTYLGSVERGERNLTLGSVVAIAGALGVTPSVLFHEAGF